MRKMFGKARGTHDTENVDSRFLWGAGSVFYGFAVHLALNGMASPVYPFIDGIAKRSGYKHNDMTRKSQWVYRPRTQTECVLHFFVSVLLTFFGLCSPIRRSTGVYLVMKFAVAAIKQ